MALNFSLVKNHLTGDGLTYKAQIGNNETFDESRIVDLMINRGSTVTKGEAMAVLEEFGYALTEILKSGNNVNTSLFCVYPSIGGTFASELDSFNSSRHSIRMKVTAGTRLKQVIPKMSVQRFESSLIEPVLRRIIDFRTGVVNDQIGIGSAAILHGLRLKYDAEDLQQGLFFINQSDLSETRVSRMVINLPQKLHFVVPETLLPGIYLVELRTSFGRKSLIKGRLNALLSTN